MTSIKHKKLDIESDLAKGVVEVGWTSQITINQSSKSLNIKKMLKFGQYKPLCAESTD